MNNHPSHPDQPDNHKTEEPMMRFGNRQVHQWAVYASLGIITAVLFVFVSSLGITCQVSQQPPSVTRQKIKEPAVLALEKHKEPAVLALEKHRETTSLIKILKEFGLWELPVSGEIPSVFIKSYPVDLNEVEDVAIKKRVFLHSLIPQALFVRQEALYRREKFESILSKIDCSPEILDFGSGLEYENQCSWTDFLVEEDVNFIQQLCKDYRTTSVEVLFERVDAIPVSIILAQGALESSWGSSRFSREGNSIFGMWTWKTAGIVPSQREDGKTHKVKVYENVLESVRSYHLTLNRLDSYEEFRQLRLHTDNPLILAEGLTLYSERGQDYVEDIKNVILSNDLQRYDSFTLTDPDLPEFAGPVSTVINLAGQRNASL